MKTLVVRNRQHSRLLDVQLLRSLTRHLLEQLLGITAYELGVNVVAAEQMAFVNESFLQHAGSTDVITFDYSNETFFEDRSGEREFARSSSRQKKQSCLTSAATSPFPQPSTLNAQPALHGELFICIDDAIANAQQFRTTWQSELVRYIVHGVLHLRGYDDLAPAPRKKMKSQENGLLKKLCVKFPTSKLHRTKS